MDHLGFCEDFDLVPLGWGLSSAFLTRPQVIPTLPPRGPNFGSEAPEPASLAGRPQSRGGLRRSRSRWIFTGAGDPVTSLCQVIYIVGKACEANVGCRKRHPLTGMRVLQGQTLKFVFYFYFFSKYVITAGGKTGTLA